VQRTCWCVTSLVVLCGLLIRRSHARGPGLAFPIASENFAIETFQRTNPSIVSTAVQHLSQLLKVMWLHLRNCSFVCNSCTQAFVKPPDIVVGGLSYYRDSICLLLSSFYSLVTLRARWTKLNQNRPHAWQWERFQNACPKSGLSLPPKNRGLQNHFFDDFSA